jgi:predicted regulator of Ras-like GTPase activity (Roadblock/LC7/MglB family)
MKKGGDELPKEESTEEKLEEKLGEIMIEGVEAVAVIDDMGEILTSIGKIKGIDEDILLAQTTAIYGISASGGKTLKKGTLDEVNAVWENGKCILRNIGGNYMLLVLTSEEAVLEWVRSKVRARLRAIKRLLGVL